MESEICECIETCHICDKRKARIHVLIDYVMKFLVMDSVILFLLLVLVILGV